MSPKKHQNMLLKNHLKPKDQHNYIRFYYVYMNENNTFNRRV